MTMYRRGLVAGLLAASLLTAAPAFAERVLRLDEAPIGEIDPAKAKGEYRGAYFAPQSNLPRVSLQKPYLDLRTGEVVDKTLIVMVRE